MTGALLSQRWRDRKEAYRHDPAERIDPRQFEVAQIEGAGADNLAGGFVRQHHDSGTFPAARFRFGLYQHAELVGVAVFSVPVRNEAITGPLGIDRAEDGTDLGRFVLLDSVKWNGETWFLARCFEKLRALGLAGAVSMSDPMARTTAAGGVRHGGHVGQIYQAFNGIYLGRGRARWLHLLPDGAVFNDRTAQKIKARCRGWEYAVAQLVEAGARRPATSENLVTWLAETLAGITRRVWHPGNHRYAWGFHPAVRRRLQSAGPYPRKATS